VDCVQRKLIVKVELLIEVAMRLAHRSVMTLQPIGVIHSSHEQAAGTPVQASLAAGVEGTVEVFPQFAPGLKDLEGFERIWLVYWFDRVKEPQLVVIPYLDTATHGLFATRAPCRPNPIGLSAVRLLEVRGNLLRVDGLDVLDNTPLLDIKPYVPSFDVFQAKRTGWCDNLKADSNVADNRFEAGRSQ
jgi:tRNA (adenine37-N6)-methyltransferase